MAKFYKKLYTSELNTVNNEDLEIFFPEGATKLSEMQQMKCEGPLTETEIMDTIKSMSNNKSPGSDGLPVEFYKVFWVNIRELFMNAVAESYETDELSILQRHDILTLLPK